jgi:hypothetical protein
MIQEAACQIALDHFQEFMRLRQTEGADPIAESVPSHHLPKLAQALYTLSQGIAGNDGAVDGTYGNACHPIGMDALLGQRLIDASLIGAQSTSALQE